MAMTVYLYILVSKSVSILKKVNITVLKIKQLTINDLIFAKTKKISKKRLEYKRTQIVRSYCIFWRVPELYLNHKLRLTTKTKN